MKFDKDVKWDVRCGYSVYQSVFTITLQKWIRERRIEKGEALVWKSGMSGWRRPEELDEFRYLFKKIKKKKKDPKIIIPVKKKKERAAIKNIAIIDDEEEICWLLKDALPGKDFNVSSANTGRVGLELVKSEQPDLVLLDLRLKDVDGISVLRKIKQIWPQIKVIIISAFGVPLIKEKTRELGADGFIDKPFKAEDIVDAIKKL